MDFLSDVADIPYSSSPRNFFTMGVTVATATSQDLIDEILAAGVFAFDIVYTGSPSSSGTFTGGFSAGLGFDNGIILTSGLASSAEGGNGNGSEAEVTGIGNDGPEIDFGASTDLGLPGSSVLDSIVGGSTNDATSLKFKFTSAGGDGSFNFIFASEEYIDFVNSDFNDVFAFVLDGVNIALVPNTTTPVAINTINPLSNSVYFKQNISPSIYNIEYDGFTTVLTANLFNLTPGVHQIELVIADREDAILDSAVFIEQGSFDLNPLDVNVNDIVIDENDSVLSVSGIILGTIPTGTGGTFNYEIQIDFGDPNDPDIQTFTAQDGGFNDLDDIAGQITFNLSASHEFLDDGLSPGNGTPYDLSGLVKVIDPLGATATDSDFITINNLAPQITSVSCDTSIDENGTVALTVEFEDVGSLDEHTLVVDWGDGSSNTFIFGLGDRSTTAFHKYLDDGPYDAAPSNGTPSDNYSIKLKLADDDSKANYANFSSTAGLDLNGSATTVTTGDGPVLRLTPDAYDQAGSAFTNGVIDVAEGFSTSFAFRISGSDFGGADGITFTLQAGDSDALGGLGGNLGYGGIPNSVAIEFDTWDNGSAFDPDANHIGINVNGSVASLATSLDADEPAQDFDSGTLFYTWIDYNSYTDLLEVFVSTGTVKPGAAALSTTIDLEAALGGNHAHAGFTAATGAAIGNHDILNWELDQTVYSVATADLTVNNVAPVIDSLSDNTAALNGVQGVLLEGQNFELTANYTDVGTKDFHDADFAWGDTTTDSITGIVPGTTSATASNLYDPGHYTGSVTVTDDDTGSDSETFAVNVVQLFQNGLDLKPGNNPSVLNFGDQGKVKLAILGSGNDDVTGIKLDTLRFDDSLVALLGGGGVNAVNVKPNGEYQFNYKDSNKDGFLDLEVWLDVPTLAGVIDSTASPINLFAYGELNDGNNFYAQQPLTDLIRSVPA